MTTGLYAGSFDPITLGHLDIIKISASIFNKVIIGITQNENKREFLSPEIRLKLIKECVKEIPNVEVYVFQGLTVNFAEKHGASVLIRGIRNEKDFQYEQELAQVNFKLNNKIKTIYIPANPQYNCISSSAVREILSNNGDISSFVPENVEKFLKGMI